MTTARQKFLTINDIAVDFSGLKVCVNNQWQPIEARQLALLKLLIEHQGQAVSRQQIMDKLWQDTIVSDNSVSQLVAQLRKSLADDKVIRTVPRVGYQLIATVTEPIAEPKETNSDNKTINNHTSILIICTAIVAILLTYFATKWLNQPTTAAPQPVASRLTSMPGPENYLRFSPNGRYLAFNQSANNRQHTDLAVYDNQTQAIHSIKTTGYSEQTPAWSPDGRWLVYYRHDPISCSIRIMSVANPVETWRLSPDFKFHHCAIGQERHKIHWITPEQLYLLSQSANQTHLSKLTLTTEGLPKVIKTKDFKQVKAQHLDINPNTKQLLYIEYDAPWYRLKQLHLDHLSQDISGKQLSQTHNHLWTVKWHPNSKQYWLGQSLGITRYRGTKALQTVNLTHGFIADMDINPTGNQLAHSEGLMNVNLYSLKIGAEPERISSAARTDLFPTLSPDGQQTLFISYQQYASSNAQAKDVWIKHKDKQAATLLTRLGKQLNPKFILWSPNNDNVLIGDHNERLHLLNIFSKHLITVVSDHQDLHSVYWSKDGKQIQFSAARQQWIYDLSSANLSPNTQTHENQHTGIKQLNSSFIDYQKKLADYLEEKLQHHLPTDNLHPSFAIYEPKVIDAGIYYVIRQGQQLKLYFYHFANQQNSPIADIGFYQQHINLPLHISASANGNELVYSRIEAIETDILLQPLTSP